MANELRTRDGLPFNFVDGLRIKGVDVTNWEKIFIDQGASYVGFQPVGNLAATNVQAAIAELDTEKVGKSELADTEGAALVGYDGGSVRTVLDNAKSLQDYAALRAYAGRAASVRILGTGIAGFFYWDTNDNSSTDNGGTIIVSSNGRRWKRLFDGAVNVKWFGAKGDWNGTTGTDDTVAIQSAVNSLQNSTGVVWFPPGTYKITSSISLQYQVSLSGSFRASKIQTIGNISAISWSATTASMSKNICIENIELIGSGKTSGYASNHGILFNHPYGIEQFTLKNIYISNFGGYGAKCSAPASDSWIVWQYAHWDTVFITECAYGTQLGNGFTGESLFSNCAITEITNTHIEFTTQAPSVTPAQGLTFNSCYFGRGKKHLNFINQCSGVVQFNNCHFEGASESVASILSTTAPFITFNDCWFIFNVAGTNVVGINYESVDVGYINIRGGRWWVYGAAVASFVKINSSAYVVVQGAAKVTGSATKQIDATAAPNTVSGNVEIVSSTEARFSVFSATRFNNTVGIGTFPSTSGKGITFPATQSPSSDVNTLDDYEEGTFTPIFACASLGDLAVSYTTQLGSYQKVGNRVTVHVDIVTSSFIYTSAAGGVFIDGHPYVTGAVGYNAVSEIQGLTKAGYTQFSVIASGILRGSGSGQTTISLQISDFPSGGSVRVRYSMTYISTS